MQPLRPDSGDTSKAKLNRGCRWCLQLPLQQCRPLMRYFLLRPRQKPQCSLLSLRHQPWLSQLAPRQMLWLAQRLAKATLQAELPMVTLRAKYRPCH